MIMRNNEKYMDLKQILLKFNDHVFLALLV